MLKRHERYYSYFILTERKNNEKYKFYYILNFFIQIIDRCYGSYYMAHILLLEIFENSLAAIIPMTGGQLLYKL